MSFQEPQQRLASWMIEVQGYDFVLQYAPGKLMDLQAILSRDVDDSKKCSHFGEKLMLKVEKTVVYQ